MSSYGKSSEPGAKSFRTSVPQANEAEAKEAEAKEAPVTSDWSEDLNMTMYPYPDEFHVDSGHISCFLRRGCVGSGGKLR